MTKTYAARVVALLLMGSPAVVLGEGGTPAAAHSSTEAQFNLDIAAQPLGRALHEFGKQSGLHVVMDSELIRGIVSKSVRGHYAADVALTLLLDETGLRYRFVDGQTVAIVRAEAVSSATGANSSQPEMVQLAQSGSTASATKGSDDGVNAGNSVRIEEIVVTAQKRTERLRDVPMPVTVVDSDKLADNNQLRLQDYYSKIPGLGLALSGDGSQPVIVIRGLGTGGQANPTVGIVVDDVPYGATVNPGLLPIPPDIDPGGLARIEVLRGPQGTLYGASSIGGLIKYVTVDPSTDAVSGSIQAGGESVRDGELGYSFRGAVNFPVSDTFAVRASGFTIQDPGYVDNVGTDERDINRRDSDGGRVSALWRPSQDFSLKLSALIQNSHRLGAADVDLSLGGGLQQTALRGTGIYDRDTEAYSATMAGMLGNLELTSVTGYSIDTTETRIDQSDAFGGYYSSLASSEFGVGGAAAPTHVKLEKFTQEIRALLPIGQRMKWLFGAFYTTEELGVDYVVSANDTDTGAAAGALLALGNPSTFDEYAAFTNIAVDITGRFDVQFGGRLSENKQTFSAVRSGILQPIFYPGAPTVPQVDGRDRAFTYLVTPRFKISSDVMVYARLASGYRPGGPNANCGSTFGNITCQYDADTTQNYEAGIKGSVLGGAISYDASLYYIDWKDIQLPVNVGGLAVTINGGRAKSQGAEFSVESKPLQGLSLSAWAAWNSAELVDPFPAVSPVQGVSGDRLPYSSRVSGNFSVDQEFPLSNSATGFIGGSVSYIGDRKGLFRIPNEVRETFPGYTQVDLNAGVRYESWTLNAFINNVTDKRGVLRGGLDGLGSPTVFTHIQPRTTGLSLNRVF